MAALTQHRPSSPSGEDPSRIVLHGDDDDDDEIELVEAASSCRHGVRWRGVASLVPTPIVAGQAIVSLGMFVLVAALLDRVVMSLTNLLVFSHYLLIALVMIRVADWLDRRHVRRLRRHAVPSRSFMEDTFSHVVLTFTLLVLSVVATIGALVTWTQLMAVLLRWPTPTAFTSATARIVHLVAEMRTTEAVLLTSVTVLVGLVALFQLALVVYYALHYHKASWRRDRWLRHVARAQKMHRGV